MKYLVIEGNIGAGKTSLAKKIAEDFNGQLILESFEDNSFLPKFYGDSEKYAFQLEMSFLAERYTQLNETINSGTKNNKLWVADYHPTKSHFFVQNTLFDNDLLLYNKFFDILYDNIPSPDLYVYLHQDVDNLIQNIKKRGRKYEQNIDPDYLKKIENAYLKFLEKKHDFPVIFIDINNIDFVSNLYDYKRLIGIIFDHGHMSGLTRFLIDKK